MLVFDLDHRGDEREAAVRAGRVWDLCGVGKGRQERRQVQGPVLNLYLLKNTDSVQASFILIPVHLERCDRLHS